MGVGFAQRIPPAIELPTLPNPALCCCLAAGFPKEVVPFQFLSVFNPALKEALVQTL